MLGFIYSNFIYRLNLLIEIFKFIPFNNPNLEFQSCKFMAAEEIFYEGNILIYRASSYFEFTEIS